MYVVLYFLSLWLLSEMCRDVTNLTHYEKIHLIKDVTKATDLDLRFKWKNLGQASRNDVTVNDFEHLKTFIQRICQNKDLKIENDFYILYLDEDNDEVIIKSQ